MAYYLRKEKKKKGIYLQMYESHWDKEKKQPRSKSVMAFGYVDDLIGMTVKDEEGNVIGEVKDMEDTRGAQRNMRVKRDGQKDALIPYVPAFIKDVDDESGEITVHVIEGLL